MTPSPLMLENVLESEGFDVLVTDILQYQERRDGNLTVEYLKNVLTLSGVGICSTRGMYRMTFAS